MIKRLKLKNFLSYKDVSIDFRDFNVLVGANASGKTNIIKALVALRNLLNGGYNNVDEFDGFMEANFKKGVSEDEALVFDVVVENPVVMPLTSGKSITFTEHRYRLELKFGQGIIKEQYSVLVKGDQTPLRLLERDTRKASYNQNYTRNNANSLNTQLDKIAFENVRYQPLAGKAFVPVLYAITEAYSNVIFTYALQSQALIMPTYSRNQKILSTSGNNLAGVLQYYQQHHPQALASINEILRRNIPNFERVDTKELGLSKNYYFVVREKDGKDYVLNELSEGTDLFIGLITAMVTTQFMELEKGTKGILIIEEPEKNLHPQLMEEIVSVAKSLTDKFQVIITTHSTDLVGHLDVEDLILLDKKKDGTRVKRITHTDELESYLDEFSLDQIWLNNDLGGGVANG